MSTKAGDDIGAGDAIMLLLNKHPIVSICIGCLALYGVSMLLFIQRDEDNEKRKAWIEDEQSPVKK